MAIVYDSRKHKEWLGLIQPVGLVVSIPALEKSQAYPDRNVVALQVDLLRLGELYAGSIPFLVFASRILGWELTRITGSPDGPPLHDELSYHLPDVGETLRPTFAVPDVAGSKTPWLVLGLVLSPNTDLDTPPKVSGTKSAQKQKNTWHTSPQLRLERLLRECGVPIGILTDGTHIRLVYAPRGESTGYLTFQLSHLTEVDGRPLLSALVMLLGWPRLVSLPESQRLGKILSESRKHQAKVSTLLAEQVLEAFSELVWGFGNQDRQTQRELFARMVREEPDAVYGGLLAVILRLVFLLYAEERDLISLSDLYQQHYSVTGLFEHLRLDAQRYPDTMDHRYGAYSRLLVLFRMIFDGCDHPDLKIPPRYGDLFNPDGWGFLEGRPQGVGRSKNQPVDVPRISDGTIYRMLEKLLMLDGERLSYRGLDVEQLGSVYENMMGFQVVMAEQRSMALRPHHSVVGLQSLLAELPTQRAEWLKTQADVELKGKDLEAVKKARTVPELESALKPRISPLNKRPIAQGNYYLQPTDERRRSGSHYTPRELTEPIVETTLGPLWEQLGAHPTPETILGMKIVDPAMGSGAFLVETCRQLADRLVDAYDHHGRPETLENEADLQLAARRIVAQTCLYGVDKNRFAVDLGKLSLWLFTLAKDHTFTFLDHAIRHGDSLVGLDREQLVSFHWAPQQQVPLVRQEMDRVLKDTVGLRNRIGKLALSDDTNKKRALFKVVGEKTMRLQAVGNRVVACFFEAEKTKDRNTSRARWELLVQGFLSTGEGEKEFLQAAHDLSDGDNPIVPFHWELEFPEVFTKTKGGFDAVVGNPPFAGKNTLLNGNRAGYLDWLQQIHPLSHGNSDLVAHFFRRAFTLVRPGGTVGFIATNTISQGDTRSTGLQWICTHGGEIFAATKRKKWPGRAAVIVSVVHLIKGRYSGSRRLDGRDVPMITAFLVPGGTHEAPLPLKENAGQSFIGSYVLGMGFTFDDTSDDATLLTEMTRLIEHNPKNQERIFPYIGGEEINTSPTHSHHRYVINFGDLSEQEAREGWPELMEIVERRVKPGRMKLNDTADGKRLKERWWLWGRDRPALTAAIRPLERVVVNSQVSTHMVFTFQPTNRVFAHTLNVYPTSSYAALCALQSRLHEVWARFFASSMKDDLRYTPSDCFETFPFPPNWQTDPRLEQAGQSYYEFRAAWMVHNQEGLTKTYNRFHNPEEDDPGIVRLRELHNGLDRAMLDAYGWTDLHPEPGFYLDYDDGEEDDDDPYTPSRSRKKPWRYRWPDLVQDEILARLWNLQLQRKAQEIKIEAQAPQNAGAAKKPSRSKQVSLQTPSEQMKLL